MRNKWLLFYNSKYFLPLMAIIILAVETVVFIKIMDDFNLWVALIAVIMLAVVVKVVTTLLTTILGRSRHT